MPLTTLDPRSALVVIDLQAGVLGMETRPHSAAEVLERSQRLARAFRERGLLVVLVRVSFAPDGADATPGRTEAPPRPAPP
ncbi:MAG: isochorismatase family protein, partial [Marmoricola sp.]|nr:isochorismatase family protein [Marmoricola sp.]